MTQRTELSETFKKIAENLHFVLVEPEAPGNIGAVARAVKTSGFKKLVLVNPCDITHKDVRIMAHRSMDIVEKAQIVSSFQDAIGDKRQVVATTMRKRHFKFPFFSPQEIADKLLPVAAEHPVAIVFGREHAGLSNKEILQCHLHSTITTATQNPALNLSQSVMIYAHTLFMQMNKISTTYQYNLASQYEQEKFYEHLEQAMRMVNFVPRDGMDDFITRFRRLIGRTMAEQRDIRLLHKLLQIFETRISQLEKQVDEKDQKNIY